MKLHGLAVVLIVIGYGATLAAEPTAMQSRAASGVSAEVDELLIAQNLSCSGRRLCGQIATCDDVFWYYRNCSWGPLLDSDRDGRPCETKCGGP